MHYNTLVAVATAVLVAQLLVPCSAHAQEDSASGQTSSSRHPAVYGDDSFIEERIRRLLVDDGFANVAVAVDEGRVAVVYENARYRDPRRALTRVAELLLPEVAAEQELVLVPTITAIPLISARYLSATPGVPRSLTPSTVSLDVSDLPRNLFRVHRSSSSFGRVDVVVHPWFEASFGDYDNPIASRTGVAPEFRVAIRPGLSVWAQALLTMQDDLPTGDSQIRPGLVVINQMVRLPRNVFVSATAGTFTHDRYGLDVEAAAYSANGRWSVGAELGITGASSLARRNWSFSPMSAPTALVTVARREARYGVTVRTTAGVFLGDERGARVDVARRFGEFELGWFGAVSELGTNGGVTLRVPLPQRRYAMPGTVRVRAAEWFPWQYRYRSATLGGRPYTAGGAMDQVQRGLDLVALPIVAQTDSAPSGREQRAMMNTAAVPAVRAAHPAPSPSLTGTIGLVVIPTAEMPASASAAVGANLIAPRYHGYQNAGFDRHPAMVEFASVGFLPFLEVGLRLSRVTGVPRQALGDRAVSVRLRLLKEATWTPAVVVGAADLVGTRRFHTIYGVASKSVAVPQVGTVGLHLGSGGDPLSLRRRASGLGGAFGGISLTPVPWASLMAEYDTEHVNVGARVRMGRIALLAAAQNLDGLSAGITYTQPLHR